MDQPAIEQRAAVSASDGPVVAAFYLPQFHPIAENDEWWGVGFTEWTNVAKARPMYPGHQQPQLPADLGFYDLRCEESQLAQAQYARRSGVTAFAYWHYWFGGKQLLQRPAETVLASSEPHLPFFFTWANESWSGAWHGRSNDVLVEQTYPGPEDEQRHFAYLEPFFHDPRHVRIGGRPVMGIYKPQGVPDCEGMLERWNAMAQRSGLDGIWWLAQADGPEAIQPLSKIFDGVFLNPSRLWTRSRVRLSRVARWLPNFFDGEAVAASLASLLRLHPNAVPCVLSGWDNTPRSRGRGWVMTGDWVASLRAQLDIAVDALVAGGRPPLLLVKSWNEWAEGNCIEPGGSWGHGFADAMAAASERLGRPTPSARPR